MSWTSNLFAQSYGVIGIDEDNKSAVLNILDDDNLNKNTTAAEQDSWLRRTVVIERASLVGGYDGTEADTNGGTGRSVQFKVRFYNNATAGTGGHSEKTTAVNPVWVTFQVETQTGLGYATLGSDFTSPELATNVVELVDAATNKYRVLIPALSNESSLVELKVYGDNIIEGDETFNIKLLSAEAIPSIPAEDGASPSDAVFPVEAAATTFKVEDKTGSVAGNTDITISTDAVNISEGGSTIIRVKLPSGITSSSEIRVTISVAGTIGSARTGDFKLGTALNPSGGPYSYPVTIQPGDEEATFTLSAETDDIIGDDGFVKFEVTSVPSGYSVGSPSTETVKINDATITTTGKAVISITPSVHNIAEGSSEVEVLVSLPAGVSLVSPLTVDLQLTKTGGATRAGDVTLTNGTEATGKYTVVLPATAVGVTSQIRVKVKAELDNIIGDNGTIVFEGVTPPSGYSFGTDNKSTVNIQDEGITNPDKTKISVTPASQNVTEGGSDGSVLVSLPAGVSLTTPLSVELELTKTEGATRTGDVTLSNGAETSGKYMVVLPATAVGVTSQISVTVKAEVDTYIDDGGTVVFEGVNPPTSYSFASDKKAIVNIIDAQSIDPNNKKISFNPTAVQINEGEEVTIKVELPNGLLAYKPITLPYTITGTADYTVDYTLNPALHPSGTVTILQGDNYAEIKVSAKTDVLTEASETVIFTGVDAGVTPSDYSWKIGGNVSTVTINDVPVAGAKDIMVEIIKTTIDRSTSANRDEATLKVTLSTGFSEDITIAFNTSTSTLASGEENFDPGKSITIPAGSQEATVKVWASCNLIETLAKSIVITGSATASNITGLAVKFKDNVNTINIKPGAIGNAITTEGSVTSICYGTPNFKLTAPAISGDVATTMYQWFENGSPVLSGYGETEYMIPASYVAGTYSYYVIVATEFGCERSTASTPLAITVLPLPKAIDISSSSPSEICGGAHVEITSSTEEPAGNIASYQWYVNGEKIVGANAKDYTIQDAKSGDYYVVITNTSGCTSTSGVLTFTFTLGDTPVTPVIEPSTKDLCGGGVTLTALRSGTLDRYTASSGVNVTYKWYKDGASAGSESYIGVNDNTFYTTEAGSYKVIVFVGGCPSNPSAAAAVTGVASSPLTTPLIAPSQPTVDVCGNSLTLTLANASSYSSTARIQWYREGYGAIAGATDATYTAAAGYTYSVAVTDGSCESPRSATVTLNKTLDAVNLPVPVIESNPVSAASDCGGSVLLSVSNLSAYETSFSTRTFQWYKVDANGMNGTAIAGATGSTYKVNDLGTNYYRVVALYNHNSCIAESNSSAVKEVSITGSGAPAEPLITAEPSNAQICTDGGIVLLTAMDNNTNNPYSTGYKYYWYRGETATETNLVAETMVNVYSANAVGFYSVVVEDASGCKSLINSNVIHVTSSGSAVGYIPVIEKKTTGDICAGGTVTFEITNYQAGVSYQWYNEAEGKLVDVSEPAYGTSRTFVATGADGFETRYYVVASASGCLSESNREFVKFAGNASNVPATPVIVPTSSTYCDGGSTTLYVQNSSAYTNPVYEWHSSKDGILKNNLGIAISKAVITIPSHNFTSTSSTYWVVVKDGGCQSLESNYEAVTKTGTSTNLVIPQISSDGNTFCAGGSITITVDNSAQYPSDVTYEWHRTDKYAPISTNTIPTLFAKEAGTYYVVVKEGLSGCQSLQSNEVTVSIDGSIDPSLAKPEIQSTSNVICKDGTIELKAVDSNTQLPYASDKGYTYTWYRNGKEIAGKTGRSIIISLAGDYQVVVNDNPCQSVESDVFSVTINNTNPAPTAAHIVPTHSTITGTGSRMLTIDNNPGGTQYEWYKLDEDGVTWTSVEITNAPSYRATQAGEYMVIVMDGTCRSAESNIAEIALVHGVGVDKPYIELPNGNDELCIGVNGASVELKAVKDNDRTDYPDGTKFIWFFSNDNGVTKNIIAGAIQETYHAESVGHYYVIAEDAYNGQSAESDAREVRLGSDGPALEKPKILSDSNSTVICAANGTLELTAVRSSNEQLYTESNLTYRWFKDGQLVQSSASAIYHAKGSNGTGGYNVKVLQGTCESLLSDTLKITGVGNGNGAPAAPKIEAVVSEEICSGGTTTLKVTDDTRRTDVAYHWYGVNQGYLGDSKVGASIAVSEQDYYYVIAKNKSDKCPSEESNHLFIKVSGTGVVPAQPQIDDTTGEFCGNGSYTINIENMAAYNMDEIEFQWNGETQGTLNGETGSSLVVAVADTYWVVARNKNTGCQSVESKRKVVEKSTTATTNLVKPVVVAENNVREICVNGSVTLSVSNLNSYRNVTNLSFQWYNTKGRIDGAVFPTYIATEGDEIGYYVVARDGNCQSLPSNRFPLNMGSTVTSIVQPVIVADPDADPAEMCQNGSIKLTAKPYDSFTYDNSLNYKWYVNGVLDTEITGAVYVAEVEGTYTVVVTDGTCQSVPAYKEVEYNGNDASGLAVEIQPSVSSFCEGGSTPLKAVVVGGAIGTFTYEWYYNNQPIPGATTGEIYYANVAGRYSVVVKDGSCASKRSADATVNQSAGRALDKPMIVANPDSDPAEMCKDGSIELKAISTGTPYDTEATIYIWYDNVTGNKLKEGKSDVYNADKAGEYYVVVTNGCPSMPSDVKVVVVNNSNTAPAEPEITVEPTSQEICSNGSVRLTATPKNGGTYSNVTFKWYKDGREVAITTTNIYHALWVLGDSDVTYTVKVYDNVCQSKESAGVIIRSSGNSAPSKPWIEASSEEMCIGGMVIIKLTKSEGGRYEWYRNGIFESYTLVPEYHATIDGTYYAIVTDGDCRSIPSNEVKIESSSTGSTAPGQPTISPAMALMCEGGSVELTTSYVANAEYIWFKDGAEVAVTLSNYYRATAPGVYTVAIKDGNNGCISKESSSNARVDLSGNEATGRPTITASSNELCVGLDLILTAQAEGNITSYKWYEETRGYVGSGQTLRVSEAGKYTVSVETDNSCWSVESASWNVVKSNDPSCLVSHIILSVDDAEVHEGVGTSVRAKLADGYVATTTISVDITVGEESTAERGNCTIGNGHNDFQFAIVDPIRVLIPAGGNEAAVALTTCIDEVYEGDENVTFIGKHNGAEVSSRANLIVKDDDAAENGKLNLLWELKNTNHPSGRTDLVDKGQTATFILTAIHPRTGRPIAVQNEEKVGLTYVNGSTAVGGTHYRVVESATMAAGTGQAFVDIETIDDNVRERNELALISDIVTEHYKVHHISPTLYINSLLNLTGGFDFTVALTPLNSANTKAEVVEGEEFLLTIATDGGYNVGENVSFNISQINMGIVGIAKLGVDYNVSSTATIQRGASSVSIRITTADNDLFDKDREFHLLVEPADSRDVIVSRSPDPLIGVIKDNDKLCLTVTSEIIGLEDDPYYQNASIKGLDGLYNQARIIVKVNNLGEAAGGVVLQLENVGTATHYLPVNELTTIPISLSTANPMYDFKVTTTLTSANEMRDSFEIKDYVPVAYEELIVGINDAFSNIKAADLDCFEPVTIAISDDFDQDGLPNWLERGDDLNNTGCEAEFPRDTDGDKTPNEWDTYDANADDDGDGISNWMEDTNRDGNPYNDFAGSNKCIPNFANSDSDGDGVPDSVENWTNRPYDDNKEGIRIHPALSLNDDGIGNDYLYIENIHKYKNKVTIFDRQGIVVFETDDYRNTSDKAFNGIANKAKSGKKIPLGTYFVIVEYTTTDGKKYYDKAVEVRY